MMYVDTVHNGLLQSKEVHWLPLQYVCGSCEELVKAPTSLLISLKYTCEYRNQMYPQTPTEREKQTQRGRHGETCK